MRITFSLNLIRVAWYIDINVSNESPVPLVRPRSLVYRYQCLENVVTPSSRDLR
jgi:hypothetical protein